MEIPTIDEEFLREIMFTYLGSHKIRFLIYTIKLSLCCFDNFIKRYVKI